MAFIERNWLARIGIGLNKFIIGDKDGAGKQTLTNSPDSITQQGDVISADNLNNLEERIATAFTDVDIAIEGLKLETVWENPNPSSPFAPATIPIDELASDHEYIIEYAPDVGTNPNMFERCHIYFGVAFSGITYTLSKVLFGSSTIIVANREIAVDFDNDQFIIGNAVKATINQNGTWSSQNDNNYLVPTAIWSVGQNIYKN